jgi:uncharacterized lipoprotein YmbA
MNYSPLLTLALGAVLAQATTGCLGLKPRSDPAQFYALTTVPFADPATPPSQLAARTVLLTRVIVPDYLAHPGIVVRDGEARVHISEIHLWAEPVRDGVTRILRDALAARLGPERVHPIDTRRPRGPHLEVEVTFSRFELSSQNEALLDARWQLIAQPEGARRTGGVSHQRHSFTPVPEDYSPGIVALSRCLAGLADDLATRLPAESGPRSEP